MDTYFPDCEELIGPKILIEVSSSTNINQGLHLLSGWSLSGCGLLYHTWYGKCSHSQWKPDLCLSTIKDITKMIQYCRMKKVQNLKCLNKWKYLEYGQNPCRCGSLCPRGSHHSEIPLVLPQRQKGAWQHAHRLALARGFLVLWSSKSWVRTTLLQIPNTTATGNLHSKI